MYLCIEEGTINRFKNQNQIKAKFDVYLKLLKFLFSIFFKETDSSILLSLDIV